MERLAVFLQAEWRHLLMLNYAVDPALLQPLVPDGTELDYFEGQTFVSMVGFRFLKTRVLGLSIPLHEDFEEVNMRFYVRGDGQRGVVFVRELVPRAAIATVASVFYNEPYRSCPMRHTLKLDAEPRLVRYEWLTGRVWGHLAARPVGDSKALVEGSAEAFITEHYVGFNRQRDGSTMAYQVEHPPWRVWAVAEPSLSVDAERLYGQAFVSVLQQPPVSAFLADGSEVVVRRGYPLRNATAR